jgi:membrane protein
MKIPARRRFIPGTISWHQRWQESNDFLREVSSRFTEDRVALAAGAISFFTLLSIFPVVLLLLTFFAREFNTELSNLGSALGPGIVDLLQEQIVSALRYTSISYVVALALGLWSGSQVFLILESAMNLAWHAQRKRPYWLRRGLSILMLIIVGLMMLGAIVLVNAVRFIARLKPPWLEIPFHTVTWLATILLTVVIPILLIAAVFALVYRVLPTRRVTVRAVVPGALVAAVLWLVSLHAFSWYALNIARYQVLYKTLAGLVFLLLWFYYSAFILLLGAEISAAYHRRLVESGDKEERRVEEIEQPSLEAQEWRHLHARLDNATNSVAYYGYQSEE